MSRPPCTCVSCRLEDPDHGLDLDLPPDIEEKLSTGNFQRYVGRVERLEANLERAVELLKRTAGYVYGCDVHGLALERDITNFLAELDGEG